MNKVARAVVTTYENNPASFDYVFNKYFLPGHKCAVIGVFTRMIEPATIEPDLGSDYLNKLILVGDNYGNVCNAAQHAYTDFTKNRQTGEPETNSHMHFCATPNNGAYAYPSLQQLATHRCGKRGYDNYFGSRVSNKMATWGVCLSFMS